jgi:hypothetical protein
MKHDQQKRIDFIRHFMVERGHFRVNQFAGRVIVFITVFRTQ